MIVTELADITQPGVKKKNCTEQAQSTENNNERKDVESLKGKGIQCKYVAGPDSY